MAKSKNRPQYKVKKKAKNIKKQKQREQMNELKKELSGKSLATYTYHKDMDHVKVPMQAWQMLGSLVKTLQPFATLFSVMEQISEQHVQDGTLLPVMKDEMEVMIGPDNAPVIIQGQIQYKIKNSYWDDKQLIPKGKDESKIVGLDGSKLAAKIPVKEEKGNVHPLQPQA